MDKLPGRENSGFKALEELRRMGVKTVLATVSAMAGIRSIVRGDHWIWPALSFTLAVIFSVLAFRHYRKSKNLK